jgi:hypothetical protein
MQISDGVPATGPSYLGCQLLRKSRERDHVLSFWVRLVQVLSPRNDGILRVRMWNSRMKTGNIRSGRRYNCLSYMWGDQTDLRFISVNGIETRVGRSLYDFLENASQRRYDKNIWIDALCINQTDNLERSAQVQMMGHIYAVCSTVIVWLGKDETLGPLCDWINARHWQEPLKPEVRSSLAHFCSHAYWTRLWITQEVMLARKLQVWVGHRSFCWFDFTKALRTQKSLGNSRNQRFRRVVKLCHDIEPLLAKTMWIREAGLLDYKRPKSKERPITKMTVGGVTSVESTTSCDFADLLDLRKEAGCEDPRDHVYGLLAIVAVPRGEDGKLRVDYDEPVADLFWRAGEHYRLWGHQNAADQLRVNLKLSYSHLFQALDDDSRHRITVSVMFATFLDHKFPFFNRGSIMRCKDRQCKSLFTWRRQSHRDILLCLDSSDDGLIGSHAILHPPSRIRSSRSFTISLPTNERGGFALQELPPHSLGRPSYSGQWRAKTSWPGVEKKLRKGSHPKLWRAEIYKLRIPLELLLSRMADISAHSEQQRKEKNRRGERKRKRKQ